MKFYFAVLISIFFPASLLHGAEHAVILLYHHVSSDTPSSTSVSEKVFQEHLTYLEENDFTVLPLTKVVKTLAEGKQLPDRTVSITFDDAYRSVLENAVPFLVERNWPFTVFVNTLAIDSGYRNYLNWQDLRYLLKSGAEVGNHSHSHAHLVRRLEGESLEQWRTRVIEDVKTAGLLLKDKLGVETEMFAYPYGEYSPDLQEIINTLGYYGIAQQSGAVGKEFDKLAVPRFPMAANFARMRRFVTAVKSRSLPITDTRTGQVVLKSGETSQHTLEFTLLPDAYRQAAFACFSSSGERLDVTVSEGNAGNKRIALPLPDWQAGRRKINCTAPSVTETGVYYWYSWQWLVTQADGQWYAE